MTYDYTVFYYASISMLFSCFQKVGENLSLIQSVKDSTYYEAYSDRILSWETKMTDLDFYLRHLSQIQIKYSVLVYTFPSFHPDCLHKRFTIESYDFYDATW